MTTPDKNGTQKQRVLWYMQQHPNQPIPCYRFPAELKIMRYGARLWELMKEGYPIENKTYWNKHRQKISNRIYNLSK